MFEQLKSWFSKCKQQRPCRPRPRTILSLEALEERWCPAGDAYLWDPAGANLLANNPANWRKNGNIQGNNGTLPGNNANDTVTIDGTISQQNIEWNQNFTFSTMTVQGMYNGTQTIDTNKTVDLTGINGNKSLDASTQSLEINFADNTAKLQIDNNATIASFGFARVPGGGAGAPGGIILIDGGTTTICTDANNPSFLWGTLEVSNVNEGETTTTLEDKGKSLIALIGNNTSIQISPFAVMQVDGGAGQTLIRENVAGTNDYIWVNGGELNYLGKAGVTDTFTAPILVGSGVFNLDGGGGGTLAVNGKESATENYSIYCSGAINLSNGITLNTNSGIKGTVSSVVRTLDNQTDTIAVASGNPCIMDGSVQIDTATGTYGHLVVNCDTLDFGGSLNVTVDDNSDTCDQLIVNGTLNLDPTSSALYLNMGSNPGPEAWTVVTSTGGAIGFGNNSYFGYISGSGLWAMYNDPSNGDLTIYNISV